MKKLAICAMLLAFAAPAVAADTKSSGPPADDPMKGWSPPKIKNEKADRAEIQALMNKFEAAGKKGDIESVMSLIDFPVLMTTDNSKGEAMSAAWDAEQYRKEMEPYYKPMPDMKVKHKPTIFLMTDSLATVTDISTVTMGNKTITARNAMLLVRTGGAWKVKAMTEGGWGDMMGGEGHSGAAKSTSTTTGTSSDTSTATSPGTGSTGTAPSSTSGTSSDSTTGSGSTTGTGSMSGSSTDTSSPGTGATSTDTTTGTGSTSGSSTGTDTTSTGTGSTTGSSSTTASSSTAGTGASSTTPGSSSSGTGNAAEPAPNTPPASR